MSQAVEPKRATIYDVARVAGVSHQTVSRFVKGSSNIATELQGRIELAIAELNYRPNVTARNLATQRPNVIGVLAADIYEYGPTQTLVGIREAAQAAGFLVDVVRVNPAMKPELDAAFQVFQGRDLAGLLAIAPADALLAAVDEMDLGVPIRVWQEADDRLEGSPFSINELGQDLLVEHLAALGHTRFASISGPQDWISARHRHSGLLDALTRRDLVHVAGAIGDWSASSGHRAVSKLGRDFTALVAENDQMALGAVLALEDLGISVPNDVSVVGFDDVPESAFFRPPLTTVRQDFVSQGRVAFSRILRDIQPSAPDVLSQVEPILVVRRSTSAIRA